jgi:hypothetical protein
VVFQFGGFLGLGSPSEDDRRSLVLRALETVEDVDAHLRLTEILVRALAALEIEEEKPAPRAAAAYQSQS